METSWQGGNCRTTLGKTLGFTNPWHPHTEQRDTVDGARATWAEDKALGCNNLLHHRRFRHCRGAKGIISHLKSLFQVGNLRCPKSSRESRSHSAIPETQVGRWMCPAIFIFCILCVHLAQCGKHLPSQNFSKNTLFNEVCFNTDSFLCLGIWCFSILRSHFSSLLCFRAYSNLEGSPCFWCFWLEWL